MEYVRLGNTGLKVSRLCLGTMTYGTPKWRPWVLDEAASRPFLARALEHGINFFDTADMYSRGVSEEVLGRALKELATARSGRASRPRRSIRSPTARTSAGCRASTCSTRSTDRCAGWASTTSTSIRSIASIPRRRSKKPSKRSTTSSRRARRATSARRACTRGSSRRCWPSPTRTAGRGSCRCRTTTTWSTARKSARCCRSAARRASGSSRGARSRAASSPATAAGPIAATRCARKTDDFAHKLYYAESRLHGRRPRGRARRAPRRQADADRAGVAAGAARRDRADRRRLEAGAPRRSRGGASTCGSTPRSCAFLEEPYQPHAVLGHT